MSKDKCETCEHNKDSGTEYCGTCAGGVESNYKEATWVKNEMIADLKKQLQSKYMSVEEVKDTIDNE
jgi:hypothetical protein